MAVGHVLMCKDKWRGTSSFVVSALLVSLAFMVEARTVAAQGSRCADCHFANPHLDPWPSHTDDWESSAHGRNGVGCESCHRGDASTFESFAAHRGIESSRNPASPTHRGQLPRTCGACHVGPYVAFQKSQHFALLGQRASEGPTCSTCHGPVAARLLSPTALEKQCDVCHGSESDQPRADRASQAGHLITEVHDVRESLVTARSLLDRVDDPERRQELEDAYEQAEVPLREAVADAHAFVFDAMKERLETAKARSEALLQELANPGS